MVGRKTSSLIVCKAGQVFTFELLNIYEIINYHWDSNCILISPKLGHKALNNAFWNFYVVSGKDFFDIQNVYCLLFTVWMQTSCTIIHFDKSFHFFLCPNCNKASKHSFDCHLSTNNLHSAEFTAWSSDLFCFLIELRAALIPSTGNLAIRSTFRMVSFWKDISGNTSVKRPRS